MVAERNAYYKLVNRGARGCTTRRRVWSLGVYLVGDGPWFGYWGHQSTCKSRRCTGVSLVQSRTTRRQVWSLGVYLVAKQPPTRPNSYTHSISPVRNELRCSSDFHSILPKFNLTCTCGAEIDVRGRGEDCPQGISPRVVLTRCLCSTRRFVPVRTGTKRRVGKSTYIWQVMNVSLSHS